MDEVIVIEPNDINEALIKPSLEKKDVGCELFFSSDIQAREKNTIAISEKSGFLGLTDNCLNEIYMDANALTIRLHPHVKDFLYKHFRSVSKIFRNILSLHEIDYLSITLITPENELLFLSSQPAIEFNLIEHNLWQVDPIFHDDFFQQDKMKLWEDLYAKEKFDLLRYYRQYAQSYSMGFATPIVFEQYRAVYSFALKSHDEKIINKVQNKTEALMSMGRLCLTTILNKIPLPINEGIL